MTTTNTTQAQPKKDEGVEVLEILQSVYYEGYAQAKGLASRVTAGISVEEAEQVIHRLITEARVSELQATKHLIEARIVIEGDDGDYKIIIEDIDARITSLKREDV